VSEVRLSGQLVCVDARQARRVVELLPEHIEITRTEPGCLSFEVAPTDDPLVWQVDELFASESAFAAHQARVAASTWGRETADIERRYSVTGLAHQSSGERQ